MVVVVGDDLAKVVLDLVALHLDDILSRRKLLALDIDVDITLHKSEVAHLTLGDKGDCRSLVTSATRAANAVNVALGILWKRVVDNVCKVVDIDTTRCNVGRNKDIDALLAELTKDLLARGLRHIAMEAVGTITTLDKAINNLVDIVLSAAENDTVEVILDIDDASEGVELVALANLEVDLLREVGGELSPLHLDDLGVAHIAIRE